MLVLMISLGIGKLLDNVATTDRRKREAELLYVGNLYKEAIRQYWQSTPAGSSQYPERLDDLLHDPRYPVTRRYLRRLYPDPVTGRPFVTIPASGGGLQGVHSASARAPIKVAGFPVGEESFATARSYQQWEFVYSP
jgi:type II secretory pathway pseudopilin PulG